MGLFEVSLVDPRLERREIGSSKLELGDEFNLHMAQAVMEAVGQHLARTEGVRLLQAAETLSVPVRDKTNSAAPG